MKYKILFIVLMLTFLVAYCLLYTNPSINDNFKYFNKIIKNNFYNITSFEVKNISESRPTNITKSDFHNTEKTENVVQVQRIDNYLKELSEFKKSSEKSKLIYPNQVLDMTNMIIDKKSCSEQFGKDLLLVVLVFNRVDGFERRQTIRETWGQDIKAESKSKLYFAIGLSKNENVQKGVEEEDKKYGDIIQFGYYESYYNCTIKALGLLRWTSMSCPFVKYLLKVDDDSIVLTNNLINFCSSTNDNSIYGNLRLNPSPIRSSNNKWAISEEDYPEKSYPNFIGGPYLIPGSKALALYETAIKKSLPAIPFEDVYVTGIVADKLRIPRKMLRSLIYMGEGSNHNAFNFRSHYKSVTIFWQGFSDHMIRKVWEDYRKLYDSL